jgi:hypothetical protein
MSSPSESEPRNPFYFLLLVASMVFVITALAVSFVPVLEDKARQAGADVPQDDLRQSLRTDGWRWLLIEMVAVVVFALASMVVDRLRRLQKERAEATIGPKDEERPTAS